MSDLSDPWVRDLLPVKARVEKVEAERNAAIARAERAEAELAEVRAELREALNVNKTVKENSNSSVKSKQYFVFSLPPVKLSTEEIWAYDDPPEYPTPKDVLKEIYKNYSFEVVVGEWLWPEHNLTIESFWLEAEGNNNEN